MNLDAALVWLKSALPGQSADLGVREVAPGRWVASFAGRSGPEASGPSDAVAALADVVRAHVAAVVTGHQRSATEAAELLARAPKR